MQLTYREWDEAEFVYDDEQDRRDRHMPVIFPTYPEGNMISDSPSGLLEAIMEAASIHVPEIVKATEHHAVYVGFTRGAIFMLEYLQKQTERESDETVIKTPGD